MNQAREIAEQPVENAQDRLHMLISGAVYDFAGFLTTQEESLVVGKAENASPVADLLRIWADKRGLKLKGASILSWQDVLTAPSQVEGIDELTRQRDKLLTALTEIVELDVLKYHHAYAIAKSAIEGDAPDVQD